MTLVRYVGDDKGVVNAARTSLGMENTLMTYPLIDQLGREYFSLDATEPPEDLRDVPPQIIADAWSSEMEVPPLFLKWGTPVLPKRDVGLLRYMLRHQHGSPFEHNLMTFKVVVPVFVDRQMVRHRVGTSKNEKSLRYTEAGEEGEDPKVFIPQQFRKQAPTNRQASVEDDGSIDQEAALALWECASVTAFSCYRGLLALGVTREQARGVLPLSLYVESYYSFNLRSLMHFLGLRDHEGAQYETRLIAQAMYQLARELFPVSLGVWDELRHSGAALP